MGKLYRIDEYWKRRAADPRSREAMGAAHSVFAKELFELRRALHKPLVLCLQNLEAGVPASDAGWDLIYSAELLNGLPAVAARQVVKTAMTRVKPGGRLLLANRAFGPNRRDEEDMAQLAVDLPTAIVGGQAVFSDASGLNVFLEVHRPCAAHGWSGLGGRSLAEYPPAC